MQIYFKEKAFVICTHHITIIAVLMFIAITNTDLNKA